MFSWGSEHSVASQFGAAACAPRRRRAQRGRNVRRATVGGWSAMVLLLGVGLVMPGAHGATQRANASPRTIAAPTLNDPEGLGSEHASEHAVAAIESLQPTTPAASLPVKSNLPSDIGQWGAPATPGGIVTAVHMALLYTGKILMWTTHSVKVPGESYPEQQAIASIYDPTTKKSRRVDPPLDNNIFCGFANTLADGRLLVIGGLNPNDGYSGEGIPVVLTFDPATEKWTKAPPMHQGRWYPSLVRLADGRAVAIGGHAGGRRNVPNYDVEVIPPNVGAPQLVAQYKLGAGEDMYPSEFQLPNGQIFSIASKFTHYVNPTNWKITLGPKVLAKQYTYPNGTILPLTPGGDFSIQLTGGRAGGPQTNWPATTTSVRINMSITNPAFKAMKPLPQARTNTNTVLLPDATMLMVGGNQAGNQGLPTYQALQYQPATDTWSAMATQLKRRAYHSTAVLLPDGTVLSGGDNATGGGGAALEVYSPPYLFKGARPTITAAPALAARGGTINVTTNVAVNSLVLVAPGVTTHATDLSQRLVVLATTPTAGTTLTGTLPSDNTLPPGPYMLFALNANGVPSVARWVLVA